MKDINTEQNASTLKELLKRVSHAILIHGEDTEVDVDIDIYRLDTQELTGHIGSK